MLRRFGTHLQDREDLLQEVFVRVYASLDGFDCERPARPWLMGIAFRVVSEHRRAIVKRGPVLEPSDNEGSHSPGPDAELGRREEIDLVHQALEAIELERKVLLLAHDMEGQSIPDIARELGIPLNTAYSRLRAARSAFAEAVRAIRAGDVVESRTRP